MAGSERTPIATSDLIDLYHERCAIMEFEAGIDQKRAEAMALQDIGRIYGEEAKKEVQKWNRSQK